MAEKLLSDSIRNRGFVRNSGSFTRMGIFTKLLLEAPFN
jgi:hypothetical protein